MLQNRDLKIFIILSLILSRKKPYVYFKSIILPFNVFFCKFTKNFDLSLSKRTSRRKSRLGYPSLHFNISVKALSIEVLSVCQFDNIQMASPALLEAMWICLVWVSQFVETPHNGSGIADSCKLVFSLIWRGMAIKFNDATFQLKHRYLLVYCLLIGGHSCFGHCFGPVGEVQWGRKTNSETVFLLYFSLNVF